MIYREIALIDRQQYFSQIGKMIEGLQVEIEIAGLDVGDQIEKEWSAIQGFIYDADEDTLHLDIAPANYKIVSLQEVIAVEDGFRLKSICVKDGAGNLRIMHFREPLRLNAPTSSL